jgi:hypothetical protein
MKKNIDELISAIKIKLKNKIYTSKDIFDTGRKHRQPLKTLGSPLKKWKIKNMQKILKNC